MVIDIHLVQPVHKALGYNSSKDVIHSGHALSSKSSSEYATGHQINTDIQLNKIHKVAPGKIHVYSQLHPSLQ